MTLKDKCAEYWPDTDEPLNCKGITVRTTSEHLWNGYASRHFQLTKVGVMLLLVISNYYGMFALRLRNT